MPIYSKNGNALTEITEKQFKLEREIQSLFEENLKQIMGVVLIKSEFTIRGKRIDTLAFDEEANAFIIIEYKRDRNFSVVDRGFTYLSLMLENTADFVLEFNDRTKTNKLRRDNVDWSQSRVAFVSTAFTENQIQATNFKDIGIELWEVRSFNNDTVSITPIKKTRSAESIKPLAKKNKEFTKITEQINVYTEEKNLAIANEEIVELYEKFKVAILNLSDTLEVVPKKMYVAFKGGDGKNIVDIEVQRKSLKLYINAKKGALNDAKGVMRDVANVGHYGNGDYQIQLEDDGELEYIMSLVKQVI